MPAQQPRRLVDETWRSLPDRPTVLVPIGSIEQHGPHLPLDTDVTIAIAVAESVAVQLERLALLVAPPIAHAASGEHQAFPGTASIGCEALRHLILELVRSLSNWAGRIVFVNAHGGNLPTLSETVTQLRGEAHDVTWAACATEEIDLHAGFAETSLMLHLRPTSVRLDVAEAGNRAPLSELMPALLTGGVAAVSANGVLGDPAGASAADGARILDEMSRRIVSQLTAGTAS